MKKTSIWLLLFAGIIGLSLNGCACLGLKCGEETAAPAEVQSAPERPYVPPAQPAPLKKDRN